MKKPPIVRVVWEDHHEPAGAAWWDLEDVKKLRPAVNESVGYLVHDEEDFIVLASSLAGDLVNRPLVILNSSIVSFATLPARGAKISSSGG